MYKKIFFLMVIAIFLFACNSGEEEAKQFSDEYTQVIDNLKTKRAEVKDRDQYVAYKADKKTALENLLKKHEKSPNVEKIEILRSKTLLKLAKLDDAEKKIDALLAEEPELLTEAKMVKAQILLEQKNFAGAHEIFKDIESKITNKDDLFQAYYYLGSEHPDNKVKEEYSNKYLNAEDIPEDWAKKKSDIYFSLAAVAKQNGELEKARNFLNEGIAVTDNEGQKKLLEKTAAHLDYIGKKAFPVTAEQWLNTEKPLDLKNMKDQVVVISFWAPWCPSCRALMPTLVEMYNENKDKGFTIIGYTRYYGRYSDGEVDKGKVGKEEELELIKKYLEKKNVSYPSAVTEEKNVFTDYKIAGLPTLIFIDKKGNIDYTKIGSGSEQFLKDKVKALIEQ